MLDTAACHCQQCAEKAARGLLTLHHIEPPKTHDVARLLELALPMDAALETRRADAEPVTPMATKFRYPDEVFAPDSRQFAEALVAARRLYTSCRSRLPEAADAQSGSRPQ